MTIDDFKIEHFRANFPDREFPVVHTVLPEKCSELKQMLVEKLGLAPDISPLGLLESLYDSFRAEQVGISTTDPNFDLSSLLKDSGIKAPLQVFINWDQFGHVDEIRFADFVKYFDYFWYSVSDDIEVFDDTFLWVVLIRHDGAVRVLHSKRP